MATDANLGPCVICGDLDNPTLEHIIPQALLLRMGVEPATTADHPFTTSLCNDCNTATSKLHNNTDLLDLIETGGTGLAEHPPRPRLLDRLDHLAAGRETGRRRLADRRRTSAIAVTLQRPLGWGASPPKAPGCTQPWLTKTKPAP